MEILEFIRMQTRPVSMDEIGEKFPKPQKMVGRFVKSGHLKKSIYCFGSGGYDGLGFRTRPWTYVYSCV